MLLHRYAALDLRPALIRHAVRAAALVLVFGACAAPDGAEVPVCMDELPEARMQVVRPGGVDAAPATIECWTELDDERISLRFAVPPGPDCYALRSIQLTETADTIAVTVMVARSEDRLAGACSDAPTSAVTEIDLQEEVGDRRVVDAATAP